MTLTNEKVFAHRHKAIRRILILLEARGFEPEESLTLLSAVLAKEPTSLGEALDILKDLLPVASTMDFPPSQPPLNRRSMVTDQRASEFFNDLEL
ncbi:MAG: hypothetical protein LBT38_00560 [Deltaproteobacteria bacterium]|jgi:hypothetical protein|nr:hypothetical protein [Deltaproteobacteria bacterium]